MVLDATLVTRAGDDLDVAASQLDVHPEPPPGEEAIRPGDWSAGGRFHRREPVAYDASMPYPPTEHLVDLLKRWNPDNVTLPFPFVEKLAVFNFSDPSERAMAETYRNAELPFKDFDIGDVERVRTLWTAVLKSYL